MPRTAHTIDQLIDEGTLNRTAIFKAIADGKLVAKKLGRRTIVLDEDYRAFLKNLPPARELKGSAGGAA
ncbi:hypothetical protein [Afipia broomeae]|uniref:Helix-turn-helix domain-containing protein n=1 Tax=Afipia broomeae ATCC 49717 TaxID=883078 RepID=K8NVL0_9BRAD|nr:hypothetical protein [Afipia broomeae]EKS34347.1 hypothetical protein HMPREF9695_04257 [Afipia broomeae ATCC 49717]